MLKRVFAILLVLGMVLSLAVPVSASSSVNTQEKSIQTYLRQAGYTDEDAEAVGGWVELGYQVGLILEEDGFDPNAPTTSSYSRTLRKRAAEIRELREEGIEPTAPTNPPTEPTDPPTEPTDPPTEPPVPEITIDNDCADVDAAVNEDVSLSIQASVSDDSKLSYQWYVCDNADKANAKAIKGATSAEYTVPTAERGTYYYYCVVSAEGAEDAESRVATVTVRVKMHFSEDGLAEPILEYVSGKDANCNDAENDIVRFCVYVETDYDTDGDGKLDLVKAFVQLPRAAMEGDYQAPVIYEARPYVEGTVSGSYNKNSSYSFDNSKLYSQPNRRIAKGSTTTVEVVKNTKTNTFDYYENLDWYDYFLVRGFAIVTAHGLGGQNSEGFQTCGTDLEIDAFACVIEWLNGRSNRAAYTDKTNNIAIKADWSNGKIGMTGRSYAGTTQYGLAALGVDGLETIVPVAGISSWYERLNSQGVSTNYGELFESTYMDWLAFYCASQYMKSSSRTGTIYNNYSKYLSQMARDEAALNGDFGDFWEVRDYTLDSSKIKCPALIVHGFNDTNVAPKHFQLMYESYAEAGVPVKMLLHQGGHVTPAHNTNKVEMYVNGETYHSILNEWFSHYLCDVSNGATTRPEVTVQSNVDGSWITVDSWRADYSYIWDPTTTGTTTIYSSSTKTSNFQNYYLKQTNNVNVFDSMTVTKDMTIQGVVEVNLRAAPTSNYGTKEGLMMSVMLVDMYDKGFYSYPTGVEGYDANNFNFYNQMLEIGGGAQDYQLVSLKQNWGTYKIISRGWVDLADPYAGYSPETAIDDPSFTLKANQYNNYTVYLQPCHYTVKAGHTLALVVCTYDPISAQIAWVANYNNKNYSIIIDRSSTSVELPLMNNYSGATPYAEVSAVEEVVADNASSTPIDGVIEDSVSTNTSSITAESNWTDWWKRIRGSFGSTT